jgi:hypothetical protein
MLLPMYALLAGLYYKQGQTSAKLNLIFSNFEMRPRKK